MSESFIQLPVTDGNAGPKVRTNQRDVSGQTVDEHLYRQVDPVNDVQARVLTTQPASTDAGAVVRQVPGVPVDAVKLETEASGIEGWLSGLRRDVQILNQTLAAFPEALTEIKRLRLGMQRLLAAFGADPLLDPADADKE